MAKTVAEIFSGLQASFNPKAVKEAKTFYFSLGDEKWTVSISPKECKVEKGKTIDEADCVLKTSPELFVKIWNGEHSPGMGDFMSGRIKSNDPYGLKTFTAAFKE